jgi:ABC-2 type transport system permease protein
MTLLLHELKRDRISLAVWSLAISFMLAVSVLIYPEMSSQMNEITDMFADMGSFSQAFGMDKLNFGEFMGFFGVECGNVLGLGGAFFAAIVGVSALAKEERDHTAEFLLSHPISRKRVLTEKFLAIVTQNVILNLVVFAVALLATFAIGEDADYAKICLIFVSYLILQLEISAITFSISAFFSRGGLAVGLGVSVVLYFLNIISNLTSDAKVLKYITPFGYTDSGYIIAENAIELKYLLPGIAISVVSVIVAYIRYTKKDIA